MPHNKFNNPPNRIVAVCHSLQSATAEDKELRVEDKTDKLKPSHSGIAAVDES